MAVFTGAGVAIVTPFHEDGSINYEAFAGLIEFQIAGGTDAIIVCGTTGEASTLSHEEHLDAIGFCVKQVAGRVPVVAGTGSNCTETAIYLSKEAQKAGVDGLLVVTPYYNKATQKGLYAHYSAIASKVQLPIIIYNVPSRTGCNILPETVVKLANDFRNIIGIKEASGNISQVAKLAQLSNGILDIYSGNDNQILPVLSLGGKGVISVLSNIAPNDVHNMVMEYLNGNTGKALEIQLKYIDLIETLFCEVNPIPVKAALNMIGYNVGKLRLPLTELEDKHKELLKTELKKVGLL